MVIEGLRGMGTCPLCGRWVGYLLCYTREDNTYIFDGNDYTTYECYVSEIEFVCPECREVLTRDEEEAEALLAE